MKSNRNGTGLRTAAAGVVMLGALALTPAKAQATLVHYVWSIDLPGGQSGPSSTWLNMETVQYSYDSEEAPDGWDIQVWGNSQSFVHLWGGTNNATFMRTPGSSSGTYAANLAVGQSVGAGGSFLADAMGTFNSSITGHWNYNAVNLVGFRFKNAAGAFRYGWMRISVAASAQNRTLVEFGYEDSGGAIAAGVVPGPGACVLLGIASLRGARRRRDG